jgi:hypothetical protein
MVDSTHDAAVDSIAGPDLSVLLSLDAPTTAASTQVARTASFQWPTEGARFTWLPSQSVNRGNGVSITS